MKVLLTNDDGYQSFLFEYLVESLKEQKWISEIKIAVPDKEQSWRATSMSGQGVIHPRAAQVMGVDAMLIDGTPADCAEWGCRYLFKGQPDFVISGVNSGANTGLGFIASSGTLGAALHANLMNPPVTGVAISQCFFNPEICRRIKRGDLSPQEMDRLKDNLLKALDLIWQYLVEQPDFPVKPGQIPCTWSFNIPREAAADMKVVRARIGDDRLGECFIQTEGGYRHQHDNYYTEESAQTDSAIAKAGYISLTQIDLRKLLR